VPDWKEFGVGKGSEESCMQTLGHFLDQALVDNQKSLRVFSSDELVSNKLDAVLNHTGRDFQWDEFSNAKGGRVIEILSEHTCQGFLQGKLGGYTSIKHMLSPYRLHTYWENWNFSELRDLSWNYTHDDGPIQQVQQRWPAKLAGDLISQASTISKPAPAGKNITASHIKILPSSEQSST
jgi:D-xylulose 5-phosphate/D-fructose 6-phosphate phosphoketolase